MPVETGSDLLLAVNISDSDGDDWAIVGKQRNYSKSTSSATVDTSNKTSGRWEEFVMGRNSAELTLEAVYVESDAGYAALQAAQENGQLIQVLEVIDGVNTRYATAGVTNISEAWPDQEAIICSMTLKISNGWTNVA